MRSKQSVGSTELCEGPNTKGAFNDNTSSVFANFSLFHTWLSVWHTEKLVWKFQIQCNAVNHSKPHVSIVAIQFIWKSAIYIVITPYLYVTNYLRESRRIVDCFLFSPEQRFSCHRLFQILSRSNPINQHCFYVPIQTLVRNQYFFHDALCVYTWFCVYFDNCIVRVERVSLNIDIKAS